MYKKYAQRGNHANQARKPYMKGNPSRGMRRIKFFDPSRFVSETPSITSTNKSEQYSPDHTFNDFVIDKKLKGVILERGYRVPTPIQDKSIPVILDGRDVVGVANTGTGKTAAFLIPLINKTLLNSSEKVLIIAPTRELAVQINDELGKLSKGFGIGSVVCIGGVSIKGQINRLSNKPKFVIGTPGRLLDLANQKKLYFRDFHSVVLDEVDRMLDMGFIHDMRKIINMLPNNRQSLFFSATLGNQVKDIMHQFIHNPVSISVKTQDAAINVSQKILKVNGQDKQKLLQSLLDDRECTRALVFVRTKRGADKLTRMLSKNRYKVESIHGNKTQNQRQRSLDAFKNGHISALVATDVVARGVDISDVTHVINYELPETYEDYLHRIGRTGRADKRGVAVTLV